MTPEELEAHAREVMAKWPKPTKEDCRIVTRLALDLRSKRKPEHMMPTPKAA